MSNLHKNHCPLTCSIAHDPSPIPAQSSLLNGFQDMECTYVDLHNCVALSLLADLICIVDVGCLGLLASHNFIVQSVPHVAKCTSLFVCGWNIAQDVVAIVPDSVCCSIFIPLHVRAIIKMNFSSLQYHLRLTRTSLASNGKGTRLMYMLVDCCINAVVAPGILLYLMASYCLPSACNLVCHIDSFLQ